MSPKREKPVIFTSDLHVDRWDRERRDSFFRFLDHVERTAAEFFIIGDILDFPAAKGQSVWPRHRDLITRLREMPAAGVPFTYIIGNHDISLRGIEIAEAGFTVTYCDAKNPVERDLLGKKVYMDHGHFHDPLFQDHIYDAMDFLRDVTGAAVDRKAVDFLKDVIRIFQRRPKHGADKDEIPAREEVGVPDRFLKIWEQAAEQLLKRMRYDIVMFGHTHAPAIVEMPGQGRKSQWYVNTGDWVAHTTFVELTAKKMALKDWAAGETLKEVAF